MESTYGVFFAAAQAAVLVTYTEMCTKVVTGPSEERLLAAVSNVIEASVTFYVLEMDVRWTHHSKVQALPNCSLYATDTATLDHSRQMR